MLLNLQSPRESLNKAYLKTRPNRSQIELFKKNILNLLDNINNHEGEEHNKNIVSEFLKNTWYSPNHYINTKGRADLVIYAGKDAASPVGVLFEVKKPENRHEMPSKNNLNSKAFQELILYYLRERIRDGNIKIKHLIITNIYEWFIFESADFERVFTNNKKLVADFTEFEEKRGLDTVTDFFYKGIAEPFIKNLDSQITFTHFDIRDFEKVIRNVDKQDDKSLIVLYKIFSPEHLLKLPFTNDSNTLDKSFYTELLHIIGLEESKVGSKKIIGRKPEGKRNPGSLLENTLNILRSEDCLSQLKKRSDFGSNSEEQYYNVTLELVITWINRILFLKLLEGQLIRYNGSDKSFSFLNSSRIEDFDELNKLFFRVLAVKEEDRIDDILEKYSGIPFLNSSLFEPTDMERSTLRINSLDDNVTLPLLSCTVLKDRSGKRISGSMKPLEYLFAFLDSYDFSSEGSEDIQEENKTLINASVLGLIFEKINGYKDGSFFTPGFITMYMCHETITRAVVQKFNEAKGWNCATITDLYNKNPEINEANKIVNSLKICDPAVGSGHFLVSALNEIIAIKSELGILADRNGKLLRDYRIEVINDELVITDSEGRFFEYNPKNKESQRVQETLFREKQTIIENCLFGVDINPNSVKICRLRLWIELLKNAYYKTEPHAASHEPRAASRMPQAVLETLPNIDINIKCGNSLISRYPLDADIRTALRSSKWTIDNYREAVMMYRNAKSKEEKRSMEELITKIKTDFESEVAHNDKRFLRLNKLKGEMMSLSGQTTMFELSKKEKDEWNRKLSKLTAEIQGLESQISEIRSNKIYENSFEWRFEFPEVLNNDGDFVGFDVVIGNPPYVRQELIADLKLTLKHNYTVFNSFSDILVYFIELGYKILKSNGFYHNIISNKFTQADYGKSVRSFLSEEVKLLSYIDLSGISIFDEATVDAALLHFIKLKPENNIFKFIKVDKKEFISSSIFSIFVNNSKSYNQLHLSSRPWIFESEDVSRIKQKIERLGTPLKDWNLCINYGIKTGLNAAFVIDKELYLSFIKCDNTNSNLLKPLLRGRDIHKFVPEFSYLYIIFIPKGYTRKFSNTVKLNKEEAWNIFKMKHPDIAEHLEKFKTIAEKRSDFGDYWWEQRACKYLGDFEKPKVIYPNMTAFLPFVIDVEKHYYHNDKSFHIISDSLFWLGSFFNSKLFKFCFKNNFPELLGGTRELRKVFFEHIPVKQISYEEEEPFRILINKILVEKTLDMLNDINVFEKELNRLVYEKYALTQDEINTIEAAI